MAFFTGFHELTLYKSSTMGFDRVDMVSIEEIPYLLTEF